MKRLQVTFFQRKRRVSSYSLEFVFDSLRASLADRIQPSVRVAPFYSNGFLRRIGIMLDAKLHEGAINHVTGDNNFTCLLLRKKRTVLTLLDVGDAPTKKGLSGFVLRLFWYKWPSKRCAIITTISEASKRDIIRLTGCDPARVVVIPIAVSEVFRPSRKDSLNATPRILQVGTSPNKNLERVIEALSGINCTLAIVGELSENQRACLEHHRIQYENRVGLTTEELYSEYVKADIVVFVSLFEGFGMPIVESQKVGRAVITSNLTSMPEVAGTGACLVDPTNVSDIRGAITKVLTDDEYRNELVKRGLENATRFESTGIAEQYLNIYEKFA